MTAQLSMTARFSGWNGNCPLPKQIAAVVLAGAALLMLGIQHSLAQAPKMDRQTNGLIMLIEFEKIEGIRQWERQLDSRGLTALVQAQHNVIAEYPGDIGRLALKGYPIAGLFADKAFWDVA